MKSIKKYGYALLAVVLVTLAGCATRTIVVPKDIHRHQYVGDYVVYNVKPAKRHCWRHRTHWHCR